MSIIKRTNSNDKDFITLVAQLDEDLWSRYGTEQLKYRQYNVIENLETVLIVYESDKPVGCGCFKKFDKDSVEIKRMFVDVSSRGKGFGKMIMNELENWARDLKYKWMVLETGKGQPEAIHVYQKQGFEFIPNYGQYIGKEGISICMKKALD